jgi:hypothetical protein
MYEKSYTIESPGTAGSARFWIRTFSLVALATGLFSPEKVAAYDVCSDGGHCTHEEMVAYGHEVYMNNGGDPILGESLSSSQAQNGAGHEDGVDHIYGWHRVDFGAFSLVTVTHFWDADLGPDVQSSLGALDDLGGPFPNSWQKAKQYWAMALGEYANGNHTRAYHYLGHVAHHIGDNTIPTHVHVNAHDPASGDDSFEDWMSGGTDFPTQPGFDVPGSDLSEDEELELSQPIGRYTPRAGGHDPLKYIDLDVDILEVPGIETPLDKLYWLLYTTNQIADFFPSDRAEGDSIDPEGWVEQELDNLELLVSPRLTSEDLADNDCVDPDFICIPGAPGDYDNNLVDQDLGIIREYSYLRGIRAIAALFKLFEQTVNTQPIVAVVIERVRELEGCNSVLEDCDFYAAITIGDHRAVNEGDRFLNLGSDNATDIQPDWAWGQVVDMSGTLPINIAILDEDTGTDDLVNITNAKPDLSQCDGFGDIECVVEAMLAARTLSLNLNLAKCFSGESGAITGRSLTGGSRCGQTLSSNATGNEDDDAQGIAKVWFKVLAIEPNGPPVADAGGPYDVNEGTEIVFDASASTDPDGDPLEYRWDFQNDGQWDTDWSTSPTAFQTWNDDWTGSVVVEVRDTWDASSTDVASVTVRNVPPILEVREGFTANEGASVSLGSTQFSDPGTLDTHTATIDWGDGTALEAGNVNEAGGAGTVSGSHVYADNGIYTVEVCVTDDDEATTCDTFQIEVLNTPPIVSPGPDLQINESDFVSLPPSLFNDLGTLDTHTAVIDWGDSTVESGVVSESPFGPPGSTSGADGSVSGTHQFGDDGVYTVLVSVTDDDGDTGIGSFMVTVINVDPTMVLDKSTQTDFGGAAAFTGRIGVEQTHNASADDIGSDDLQFIWTVIDEVFSWDFEIGNTTYFNDGLSPDPFPSALGVLPFHADDEVEVTFDDPGVYTILVTVTDDDGGATRESLPKLVVGNDSCTRSAGLWGQQFSLQGKHQVADDTLIAYLAFVDFASTYFSEVISASSIEEARALFVPRNSRSKIGQRGGNRNRANMEDKTEQALFAAWLNVASGSAGLEEVLSNGMTVLDTLYHVEWVLMDSNSKHKDYLDALAHLRLITNIGCRF